MNSDQQNKKSNNTLFSIWLPVRNIYTRLSMRITKRAVRLWGIGVGSVIGGDFFGWTMVLHGGIGAALLIIFLVGILYALLSKSAIILMVATKRSNGGAPAFVRSILGENISMFVAALEIVKNNFVVSILATGILTYIRNIMGETYVYQVIAYIVLHVSFCGINMFGTLITGSLQVLLTLFCLLVLSFFWVCIASNFNFESHALDGSISGEKGWFPGGPSAFLSTLQFGAWFYLGFEELPLVALADHLEVLQMKQNELKLSISNGNGHGHDHRSGHSDEYFQLSSPLLSSSSSSSSFSSSSSTSSSSSHAVRRDRGVGIGTGIGPKRDNLATSFVESANLEYNVETDEDLKSALYLSFITVLTCGLLNILLASSSPPGHAALSVDPSPINLCMRTQFGKDDWRSILLQYSVAICLLAPFLSFILFSAHQTHSLATDGYLPSFLAGQLADYLPKHHRAEGEGTETDTDTTYPGVDLSHVSVPSVAIIVTGIFSVFVCCFMTYFIGLDNSGEVLINMCIFPAMTSYFIQFYATYKALALPTQTQTPLLSLPILGIITDTSLQQLYMLLGMGLVSMSVFGCLFGAIMGANVNLMGGLAGSVGMTLFLFTCMYYVSNASKGHG